MWGPDIGELGSHEKEWHVQRPAYVEHVAGSVLTRPSKILAPSLRRPSLVHHGRFCKPEFPPTSCRASTPLPGPPLAPEAPSQRLLGETDALEECVLAEEMALLSGGAAERAPGPGEGCKQRPGGGCQGTWVALEDSRPARSGGLRPDGPHEG